MQLNLIKRILFCRSNLYYFGDSNSRVTFQLILALDVKLGKTAVVFQYDPTKMSVSASKSPAVGFRNVGGSALYNLPPSDTITAATGLACGSNIGTSGVWCVVVYDKNTSMAIYNRHLKSVNSKWAYNFAGFMM